VQARGLQEPEHISDHRACLFFIFFIIIVINHAFAGQLNRFTQIRALLELHDRSKTIIIIIIIIIIININSACAGQLICSTQPRALLNSITAAKYPDHRA
jgi:hypothetical protein